MNPWLCKHTPQHPFFSEVEQIAVIVSNIKMELSGYMYEGMLKFEKQLKVNYGLLRSLKEKPQCWDVVIKSFKYGVIYWLSRIEARQYDVLAEKNKNLIDDIAAFLNDNQKYNQIINYAVHRFVLNKTRKVRFSDELIPKCAIYSVNKDNIYVRKADFLDKTPEESFNTNHALYDLHDFAHLSTAILCPELYGSYYFSHLCHLPNQLKALIKSPYRKSREAIPYSDGVVFSEILTDIFNTLDYNNLSCEENVSIMAHSLVLYYLQKSALLHISTGELIFGKSPISLIELAILVQNKAYELPASEIEQMILTRGGENGYDPLEKLKISERISFLSNSAEWLYFEMRNTLKHRAHKMAYRIVAKRLMDTAKTNKEVDFLKMIIDNIDYEDFKKGKRINLWHELFVNHF